jgi:hypothetical protein
MRVSTRVLSLAFTSALLLAGALAAQTPRVLLGELSCVPKNGHALAQAIAAPTPAGSQVRIYFRRQGYGDFYWVPARPTSDGRFWGVLPVPEPDNLQAEVYAAVVAPGGIPLAQSPVRSVPVEKDCRTHLDTAQSADATSLIVGETSLGQKFRKVAWWQCEGIRERIDVKGERRNDEACVPIPLWWERPELLAPFAVVAGGGITTVVIGSPPPPQGPPELSAANP